jgi:hypothetical protein
MNLKLNLINGSPDINYGFRTRINRKLCIKNSSAMSIFITIARYTSKISLTYQIFMLI